MAGRIYAAGRILCKQRGTGPRQKAGFTMVTTIGDAIGGAAAAGIRRWVRMTGRRVARHDARWLDCPMGPPGRIGAAFYADLAERESLEIRPASDAGLLPD